jgi:septum formation protein
MGEARSLLLASNSPRRIELLRAAGFQFEVISPEMDERFDVDLTLRELTAFNALRKGIAIARKNPRKVVLAADTLVALGHEVIGKPVDLADARRILRRLSGRTHEVCSTVFVTHHLARKSTLFHEISRVRFRRLTSAGVDTYLAKVNPLDKAGAYAAQGFGAEIIEEVDGSFTNVVGLPMEKTIAVLVEFGLHPSGRKI